MLWAQDCVEDSGIYAGEGDDEDSGARDPMRLTMSLTPSIMPYFPPEQLDRPVINPPPLELPEPVEEYYEYMTVPVLAGYDECPDEMPVPVQDEDCDRR